MATVTITKEIHVSGIATMKDVRNTSAKGSVVTNFDLLVECFGMPQIGPCLEEDLDARREDYEKITCEWMLKFSDGSVATIYDYKMKDTPEEDYEWHIGGEDYDCVQIIQTIIDDFVCEGME